MGTYQVEASDIIDATPEVVYGILSDYDYGHHAILPKQYFTNMMVQKGGQGAGTVVLVDMQVMGVKRQLELTVSEPEPGRIIMEEDQKSGIKTTFMIDPIDDGQQSRVTISTVAETAAGFQGFIERLVNPPITRRIYKEELKILSGYAAEQNE